LTPKGILNHLNYSDGDTFNDDVMMITIMLIKGSIGVALWKATMDISKSPLNSRVFLLQRRHLKDTRTGPGCERSRKLTGG